MIAVKHRLEPFLAHENNHLEHHEHDENYYDFEETMRIFGERNTANIDTEQACQEA